MFFPLSKIVFFVLTPSNLLIFATLAGLGLVVARRHAGIWLAVAGALGLAVAGLSPLSSLAIGTLEQRFPVPAEDAAVTGIIVLGGGVDAGLSEARGQIVANDAGERVIALADLARRYGQARLLFSGGSGGFNAGAAEAEVVARFAGTLGLPRERLEREDRSRNTEENARFSAELVHPKPGERWLLVTSAWHMPRAVGCFRRAGFTVEAYPVDYRTGGQRDATRFNTFASDGLFLLDLAVKEWIGLAAYRLAGYIDDAFPGPEPSAVGSPSR